MSIYAKTTRVIRIAEVKKRTGLSTSTIYDWMKRGHFPATVKLGNKLVGWKEADIDHWIATRAPMEIL